MRDMILVETAWSVFSVVVGWLFGQQLVRLLAGTTDAQVLYNSMLNIRISTACFIPLGVLFIVRCSMQSMGHKILPVLSSGIELLLKVVSAVWLVPAAGFLGVAVTEPVIWCICAIFLGSSYLILSRKKSEQQ